MAPTNHRATWIDTHSVTCAICGDNADERETITLWEDQLDPALEAEHPTFVAKIRAIRDEYGNGEVHRACFDYYSYTPHDRAGWDDDTEDGGGGH